jgi:hypothetical protein
MSNNDISPTDVVKGDAARATQIGRYAQGVLVLFAIASIIAGWSGDKLATMVLTVTIVIGFAICILGFERLARARQGYYAKLGMVLTGVTLVAVTWLFLSVLSYIGLGYPVALDRFFGRQPAVAPSASVKPDAVDRTTIVVKLAPYVGANAQIEGVVFPRGDSKPLGKPIFVSAMSDLFAIRDL